MRRPRTWRNHDGVADEDLRRMCVASEWRGSPGSLQIIPNKVICLRWRIAVAGRDPAMKWTSEGGDRTASLTIFCRVLLYCWSTHETSLSERNKLPSPDIRTGVP